MIDEALSLRSSSASELYDPDGPGDIIEVLLSCDNVPMRVTVVKSILETCLDGQNKWRKKVTGWYPGEGKRKRGRPQRRWDDDIRRVAVVMCNRVAQEKIECLPPNIESNKYVVIGIVYSDYWAARVDHRSRRPRGTRQ
ncbi:hypothetical protein EVAR_57275_1 [Eumeta japonica]|uniref:Uncharacterized protein n=1 Tax=Eumeta variegata TaxID=151549 RepID=A0A4C1ZVJ5_EUMVA|nr:hypothetical protein EVAR_57275_1 [Eumeta japonica]